MCYYVLIHRQLFNLSYILVLFGCLAIIYSQMQLTLLFKYHYFNQYDNSLEYLYGAINRTCW